MDAEDKKRTNSSWAHSKAEDRGLIDDSQFKIKPSRNRRTMDDIWKMHKRKLVTWYIAAMGSGEPHIDFTVPRQEAFSCSCKKSTKSVTLYMTAGNYSK